MQKMSEKEAKDIIYMWAMERASDGDVEACEAFDMAIKALEELNQYKQGGLVLIPADVYQRQCDELDAYRAIGTVEQCREAVERMKPKKAVSVSRADGIIRFFPCPHCSTPEKYVQVYPKQKHCVECGGSIDWSE